MIVRQAAWVALGQAVVVVAGLAATRILTTLLPPGAYGEVSLVTGLGTLGTGLLCTPLLQAALRSFPEARDAGHIGALRRLTAHYLRRAVAAVGVLLLVAGALWSHFGGAALPFLVFPAAATLVAGDAWRSYESGFLNGARRQRDFALRAIGDALARPAAATALILLAGPAALSVIAGYALGSAASSFVLRRRIVGGEAAGRWQDDDWARAHRAGFLRYAAPLAPLAALNWVMSMGDRYVLAAHWGADVVGIYWAAYALGSQPFIAVNAIVHSTLRPALYDAVARGDTAKERRVMRAWLALVVAIAAAGWTLLWLLAGPICALLLGPAFGAAAALLPWVALAYAFQMLQQAFEIILYAHGESARLVLLQAVAAAVAVALFFVLIPPLGGKGAALGTLGSVLATTVLAFFLSRAWRRVGRAPPEP